MNDAEYKKWRDAEDARDAEEQKAGTKNSEILRKTQTKR